MGVAGDPRNGCAVRGDGMRAPAVAVSEGAWRDEPAGHRQAQQMRLGEGPVPTHVVHARETKALLIARWESGERARRKRGGRHWKSLVFHKITLWEVKVLINSKK